MFLQKATTKTININRILKGIKIMRQRFEYRVHKKDSPRIDLHSKENGLSTWLSLRNILDR